MVNVKVRNNFKAYLLNGDKSACIELYGRVHVRAWKLWQELIYNFSSCVIHSLRMIG